MKLKVYDWTLEEQKQFDRIVRSISYYTCAILVDVTFVIMLRVIEVI